MSLPKDLRQFVLLPAIARKNYKGLLAMQAAMEEASDNSKYCALELRKQGGVGIVTTGIARNYLAEVLGNEPHEYSILKVTQYPLPRKMVSAIYNHCRELIVMEEGAPFVEELLRGYMDNGKPIHGRLDGTLPQGHRAGYSRGRGDTESSGWPPPVTLRGLRAS